jgi:xylulokinase
MAIGGLDIGSSGAKITVMNQDGKLLYSSYQEYPVTRNVGPHEIDAEEIWKVVKDLLKNAAVEVPQLSAIGVTSFGESFVLMNDKGEVLLPTMMYTDPRGKEEADHLQKELGDDFIKSNIGVASNQMYSLPKLMWLRNNQPEVFAKAKKVCLIADYLVFKLTGNHLIEYSLAARTMGLDIRTKTWNRNIFEVASINPSLFGRLVPSGTDAGSILPEVSNELGLPSELRVVLCCHDQVAAAVGSNVTKPGIATDGGGTVQCMTPVFSSIPQDQILQDNHYSIVPFLRGDIYCCYAFSFTGGSLVKWFVDNFAAQYRFEATKRNMTVYQLMEEQMSDKPTGVLVLPHFSGAATPYMDAGSKGVFVGLELTHSPIAILQAIMEGISYEMKINMEKLAEGGIKIEGLNATGGCAKSKLWLQMKADILGVPVTRMGVDEAGTIGGIMLTGVAVGVYKSLEEAAEILVRTLNTYFPCKDKQKKYDKHYQRYRKLYETIRPLMDY